MYIRKLEGILYAKYNPKIIERKFRGDKLNEHSLTKFVKREVSYTTHIPVSGKRIPRQILCW